MNKDLKAVEAVICEDYKYCDVTFGVGSEPAYTFYNDLIKFMSGNGYYIESKTQEENSPFTDFICFGHYKKLRFNLECRLNTVCIIFFQGSSQKKWNGEFDSYLDKLEFKKIINKLRIWLDEEKCIPVETLKFHEGADQIVDDMIADSNHPQTEWFDLSELDGVREEEQKLGHLDHYMDENGDEIVNGCIRYFEGYDGYLHRGKCYHANKYYWWVLEADDTVSLQRSNDLFMPKKPLTSARVPNKVKEWEGKSLSRSKAYDYEHYTVLRGSKLNKKLLSPRFAGAKFFKMSSAYPPEDAVDITASQSRGVMMWREGDTVFWHGKKFILARCGTEMFRNTSFEKIDTIRWDTSRLENADYMFELAENLKDIDVTDWKTHKLESTHHMFSGTKIETLDVSKWDTHNMKYASGMFYGCLNLKNIDVALWDISNLINFNYMFSNCHALQDVRETGVSEWIGDDFHLKLADIA